MSGHGFIDVVGSDKVSNLAEVDVGDVFFNVCVFEHSISREVVVFMDSGPEVAFG